MASFSTCQINCQVNALIKKELTNRFIHRNRHFVLIRTARCLSIFNFSRCIALWSPPFLSHLMPLEENLCAISPARDPFNVGRIKNYGNEVLTNKKNDNKHNNRMYTERVAVYSVTARRRRWTKRCWSASSWRTLVTTKPLAIVKDLTCLPHSSSRLWTAHNRRPLRLPITLQFTYLLLLDVP